MFHLLTICGMWPFQKHLFSCLLLFFVPVVINSEFRFDFVDYAMYYGDIRLLFHHSEFGTIELMKFQSDEKENRTKRTDQDDDGNVIDYEWMRRDLLFSELIRGGNVVLI